MLLQGERRGDYCKTTADDHSAHWLAMAHGKYFVLVQRYQNSQIQVLHPSP